MPFQAGCFLALAHPACGRNLTVVTVGVDGECLLFAHNLQCVIHPGIFQQHICLFWYGLTICSQNPNWGNNLLLYGNMQ